MRDLAAFLVVLFFVGSLVAVIVHETDQDRRARHCPPGTVGIRVVGGVGCIPGSPAP